ncbi:MAG: neutral/alkaline non-lysosomal ceramidase N-terminal domain-containing protein [Planctomycetota bacterium]
MAQLLAGAARATFTPYVGAWMAGFASRDHGCEGVHDDLYARALVLRAGETTVGLVGCDLIGLSPDSVARVRQRVEAECDIAADHVMVACTHTHSGPTVGPLRHPGMDVELMHVLERQVAGSVVAASRSMAEASLGVGKGTTAIGINRRERQADGSMRLGRNPDGPVDPELGVLRMDAADGRPVAIAVTHACHPVVLGPRNYLISADYPGQVAALLETVHPGAVCPYFNGTCGNINSTPVGGSFADARRLGLMAGGEALRVAAEVETSADVELAVQSVVVDAPLAPLPPAGELRAWLAGHEAALDRQLAEGQITAFRRNNDLPSMWARDALHAIEERCVETTRALELQALRLGDALLVTTPGETFVEIGLAIKAASPLPNTFVLGYTNGNVGYIPTAAAFDEGGYEVERAYQFYGLHNFAPGVERTVTEAGIALAKEMAS